MSTLRLVYDQSDPAAERIAVVEQAQQSYAFAVQTIRDTYKINADLDALLGTMQETFDNMARIAKAVVA